MDDLTMLREFRSELPEVEPATARAARSAMFTAEGEHRHRRTRVRAAVVVIAAAVVTALVLIGPTLPPTGGRLPGATASAAQLFRTAALAAQSQPARTGTYWYVHSRSSNGNDRQVWLSPSAGLLRQSGPPHQADLGPAAFGWGLSWDELMALPTDAKALRERIGEGLLATHRVVHDAPVFTAIGDLLRESPAPPTLRAALYRVAAQIPGVRVLGIQYDASGRTGVLVARTRPGEGIEDQYLIDQKTGALLEERLVRAPHTACVAASAAPAGVQPSVACGPSTEATTYLDSEWVNGPGELPGG